MSADDMRKPRHEPSPRTSRELLVEVAGEEHVDHTVVVKRRGERGGIAFDCSCGALCVVPDTAENRLCLRNVVGEPS